MRVKSTPELVQPAQACMPACLRKVDDFKGVTQNPYFAVQSRFVFTAALKLTNL